MLYSVLVIVIFSLAISNHIVCKVDALKTVFFVFQPSPVKEESLDGCPYEDPARNDEYFVKRIGVERKLGEQ